MKTLLKEEFVKFWFGLVSTAMGVLIALTVDSCVDTKKDKETYQLMLKSLNIEAVENRVILNESFLPNYKDGIIYRDFSLKTSDDVLTNDLLLEQASPEIIKSLMNYSLNIRRANAFRERDEKFKYDTLQYKKWQPGLTAAFGKVLVNCTEDIDELIEVTK